MWGMFSCVLKRLVLVHSTPVATCRLQTNADYLSKGEDQYQTIDFASAQPSWTIPFAPPQLDTALLCFLLSQSIPSSYNRFCQIDQLRHRPASRLDTVAQFQLCPAATTSTTIQIAMSTTMMMITSTPMQEPTIWPYVVLIHCRQRNAHNFLRMSSRLEP